MPGSWTQIGSVRIRDEIGPELIESGRTWLRSVRGAETGSWDSPWFSRKSWASLGATGQTLEGNWNVAPGGSRCLSDLKLKPVMAATARDRAIHLNTQGQREQVMSYSGASECPGWQDKLFLSFRDAVRFLG